MASDGSIPIVLASGSPRRQELLTKLGLSFEVCVAPIDEHRLPGASPDAMARRLSRAKAYAVALQRPGALIIAADTLVVVEGDVLGKPANQAEALAMLVRLRNRTQEVLTGLALVDPARQRESVEVITTRVTMRNYSDDEIRRYVQTGDPMDKAGAYAIQATDLRPVARIEGSYTNVVGLPLCNLCYRLRAWAIPVPIDGREACFIDDTGEADALSLPE